MKRARDAQNARAVRRQPVRLWRVRQGRSREMRSLDRGAAQGGSPLQGESPRWRGSEEDAAVPLCAGTMKLSIQRPCERGRSQARSNRATAQMVAKMPKPESERSEEPRFRFVSVHYYDSSSSDSPSPLKSGSCVLNVMAISLKTGFPLVIYQ